jgi:hypothetical protein
MPAVIASGPITCSIARDRPASSTNGGATSHPGFWFIALRDTARDVVLETYPADAARGTLPRPGGSRPGHAPMMFRLDAHPGEWLDRKVKLSFTFEGCEYRGYGGDTISSALAAAGLPFLGRSFKYHRPRGILSFANHDSNVLFQVDGVANVRGDVTPLRDGMRVSAVNTFGGLARDKARMLGPFGRFLPVGFYYKAFHSKTAVPALGADVSRIHRPRRGIALAERRPDTQALRILRRAGDRRGPSGLGAALAAAAPARVCAGR